VKKAATQKELPLALLGESLTLSKYGIWYHNGEEFTHTGLIRLFHRSIVWQREKERYLLKIGEMMATFTLEDTAYFVRQLDQSKNHWQITLLDDRSFPFDPTKLTIGRENQFYSIIYDGVTNHRCRWLRAAHQSLLEHACSESAISYQGKEWDIKPDCTPPVGPSK